MIATWIGCLALSRCVLPPADSQIKLKEWRKGVWIKADGSYAIYTNSHLFLLSARESMNSPQFLFSASQIKFHEKGLATKEVFNFRHIPDGKYHYFQEAVLQPDYTEVPFDIDSSCFKPGVGKEKDGITYASITEDAEEHILLSLSNGDKEKIFSNGTSIYFFNEGRTAYSYRIERF